MDTTLTKEQFSNFLQRLFTIYPHFNNQNTLKNCIEHLDSKTLNKHLKNQNYEFLLFEMNQGITKEYITLKLCELESNLSLQGFALNGLEDEYENIKEPFVNMNNTNQRLIKELFTMFESRNLT